MSLSPTYNPKEFEAKIYSHWQSSGIGNPDTQKVSGSETYTLLMPPPNLTGELHAGHAFGHYVMDTLTRIHRQKGEKSLWYPGVDHAGIQLEGVIDKAIKAGEFDEELQSIDGLPHNKGEIPKYLKNHYPENWLKLAWKRVSLWRDNQAKQSSVLGDAPDYTRNLFTLDDRAIDMVNYAFEQYYKDGLIYKKSYLINWSVGLQTALSDVPEDIGHEKRKDPFVTFGYKLFSKVDTMVVEIEDQLFVSTVRPETIFADEAVAVHPDRISTELKEIAKLKQLYVQIPLTQKYIPVILADEVDPNFGTGALKITPAHDLTDYEIFHKYLGGEFEQAVGRDGKLTEICGEFAGMTVEDGRKAVIEKLINGGYVPHKRDEDGMETNEFEIDYGYEHNVTICERSKTIVEPLISEEFFLSYTNTFPRVPEQKKQQIQSIVFDFGDVVFYEKKHLMMELIFELYGLENGKHFDWEELIIGLRSRDFNPYYIEFWRQFADEITKDSIHIDSDYLLDQWLHFNENPRIIDGVSDFIQQQKAEGRAIYYLTNRQEQGMIGIRNHPIFELFDGGLGDFELGVSKPDPEIYQEFINRFGIDPSQSVFVDDRVENIETALSIGFQTIPFTVGETDIQREFSNILEFHSRGNAQTSLQKLGLEGVQQTQYFPTEFGDLAENYITNIKDWCISRDLIWGHKMPIWYNIDLNPEKKFYTHSEVIQNPELESQISIQPIKPSGLGNWIQEEKILDTWFSSCLWPLSTLGYVDYIKGLESDFETCYPTQDMITAREIFYAWIVRMTILGKYFTGKIPFENVVITPTIQDEQGKKMSKSLKNGLDPIVGIEKFSSDSMRLAMLGGMIPNRNMRLGGALADRLMEKYRNFGNKVWNVARFLEIKTTELGEAGAAPLSSASLWIFERFVGLVESLDKNMEVYELTHSIQSIYSFLWDDFADWYVEYLKTDIQQLPFAMELFRQFIVVLSPYMPFESQAIWNEMFGETQLLADTLVESSWAAKFDGTQATPDEFEDVIELIHDVRSLRGLFAIDPAVLVEIHTNSELFDRNRQFIKLAGRVDLVLSEDTKPYKNIKLGYSLDILMYIKDVEAEKIRTQKLIESLEKQVATLNLQLGNEQFTSRASQEVIEDKQTNLRERCLELEDQKKKLQLL